MEVVERKLDAGGWSQLLHFATDEVWLRLGSTLPFLFWGDLILGLTDKVFWETHCHHKLPCARNSVNRIQPIVDTLLSLFCPHPPSCGC